MKIDRNNYEEFFIDYFDGNLNPEEVRDLFAFIDKNTDIKDEFDSFENFSIAADEDIVFDQKEMLKKKDIIPFGLMDSSNYEHFFVAEIENDLSEVELQMVKSFLKLNPHLEENYHLIKLTKLKPDTSILFDSKDSLKKIEIISVGSINQTNYESFFIAYIEGDLSPYELECLEKFISLNNHLCEEFNLYKKTKLSPDTSVVYKNKNELKKFLLNNDTKVFKYYTKYISIAASILFLVSIYLIYKPLLKSNYTAEISSLNRKNIILNPHKINVNNYNNNYNLNISYYNKPISNPSSYKNASINQLQANKISKLPLNKQKENETIAFRSINSKNSFENVLLAQNNGNTTISEALTIKEFLINKLRKNVIQTGNEIKEPSNRLTAWDIAQIGIRGINKLTNSNIQLKKDELNPNNSYALIGNSFSISRNYSEK